MMIRVRHLALASTLALASCRMFEPTLGALAEAPDPARDPTRPLALPPPAPRPAEPETAETVAPPKAARLGRDEKVALEFRGTPLAEAVHAIASQAGVNVYLDAELDRLVDASFPSISLDDALETILAANGLVLVERPGRVFAVERRDGNEVVERRFQLRSARVADVEEKLRQLVASASSGEAAVVVGDVEQNFFAVRGRRKDVESIAAFLESADKNKEQVLIEMRIVEVRLGESFRSGIAQAFTDVDLGDGTMQILQELADESSSFELQYANDAGDVESTLQLLGRYAGVELLSSPHVVAVNNSEATIEIVREVPYIQTTTDINVGSTTGSTSSSSEVAFKEVGIKLKVRPAIRANGVIEFELAQELSEVAEFFNGIPAVDKRSLTSRFEVRDGTTLVVGGLMQDRKGRTDEGVPLLMDLPLLGALFKSDDDTDDKRELLLFFSPRIVSLDASDAVADRYRDVYDARRREMGLADPRAQATEQPRASAAGGQGSEW